MKNFYLAFNIFLLTALGYLYYYTFSGSGKKNNSMETVAPKGKDSVSKNFKIAYVDLDSLNEKITYFKKNRKDIEQQQKNIEAEITGAYKALEAKQNSFSQKNPNPTPDDIQNFRALLMQEQQNIETKKQNYTQQLNQKNFELVELIRKNLKFFLNEYNKQKKYDYILTTTSDFDYMIYKDSTLNITNDVIKGINEKMKASGQ